MYKFEVIKYFKIEFVISFNSKAFQYFFTGYNFHIIVFSSDYIFDYQPMGYIKKLAGQTAIYGLSSVVPRLLNYLLVPLYTRVFLPEDYGIITEMYAYLGFLLVFLTFGFETGYFRFASKQENRESVYSTAFFTLLITSTLFLTIISFFSNSIATSLGYTGKPEYIYYLAIVIALDSISAIPFARLRLLNRPMVFSSIKIIGVVINVLLNFFFLKVCPVYDFPLKDFIYNPANGVTYVFISNLVSSITIILLLVFFSGTIPSQFSLKQLKVLFIYSFPLLISGLGGTTNESFDRIFIKYLIGAENNPLYQLGIYGANVKLAVLMVLFIQMYRYAAEPFFFSNAGKKDSPEMYANMMKYFLIFTLLIFLGVGAFTDIFQLLVGKQFREGLFIVPILLLANLFYGIFFNLSIWYKLTNKTWYGIYYTFAGAAITITINILLIPNIGYYGAAVARLVCYIVMCILCYHGGKKYFSIPYDFKRMFAYFTIAIIVFCLSYFVKMENTVLFFIYRMVLVSIFIIFVIYIEKIPIVSSLKSIRNGCKSS